MPTNDHPALPPAPPSPFALAKAELLPPLLRAAAALWLPTLLPFAFGPLSECGHCVRSYLLLMPVLPGWLAAAWCRNQMLLCYAIAIVATLLVVALLAILIRRAGRRWWWVALVFAVMSGAQSIALGHLLRM